MRKIIIFVMMLLVILSGCSDKDADDSSSVFNEKLQQEEVKKEKDNQAQDIRTQDSSLLNNQEVQANEESGGEPSGEKTSSPEDISKTLEEDLMVNGAEQYDNYVGDLTTDTAAALDFFKSTLLPSADIAGEVDAFKSRIISDGILSEDSDIWMLYDESVATFGGVTDITLYPLETNLHGRYVYYFIDIKAIIDNIDNKIAGFCDIDESGNVSNIKLYLAVM